LSLSKILEIEISELFAEQTLVFNSTNQSGGNFGQYVMVPELLIQQYELRIKEKDEMIQLLKSTIESLKNSIHKNTDK
jgi:hypothetical protein